MQVRPPCLIWLSMLVAASSLAQPAPYFAEHEVPDPAVVARLLSLPAPTTSSTAPRTRTRAVRLLENAEAQGVSPRDATTSGVGHEAPLPDRFNPVAERVAVLAPQ